MDQLIPFSRMLNRASTLRSLDACMHGDADRAVMAVFRKYGVLQYERHHTGHGMGPLGVGHHKPFVDQGEEFIIQPRMAFSCEPGLYVPRFGGFRHSDTVVITEDGCERTTYYPRDIESLTVRWRK